MKNPFLKSITILLPLLAAQMPVLARDGNGPGGEGLQVLQGENRISLDIPAGDLADALKALAKQTGADLVYRPEQVEGLRTRGLEGEYTAKDAIAELLKGTALRLSTNTAGAMLIAEPKPIASLTRNGKSAKLEGNPGVLRLSKKEMQSPQEAEEKSAAVSTESTAVRGASEESSTEVVVTGSRLPTATGNQSTQNVFVYSHEQIERSGQNSVSDFLSTLPSVSNARMNESGFSGVGAVTSNLRGLPTGTTLVLLNGRRPFSSGLGGLEIFDLNNVPVSAVERIDVVADGSSAIYGSDAIAGVVNVILKQDFDGFNVDAKYGHAADISDSTATLAFGQRWDRGSLSMFGTYQLRGNLDTDQRALTASNDYTPYGGPNNNGYTCALGNVFSIDGSPLPGGPLGSTATYAAVTGTAVAGTPTYGDFQYGALNSCSNESHRSLIQSAHRAVAYAQGRFELTPSVDLFAEIMFSHQTTAQNATYNSLYGEPGFQSYTVSASNPYNPFGETVGVSKLMTTMPLVQDYTARLFRPLVGARGRFGSTWRWETAAWSTSDRASSIAPHLLGTAALQDALNSADPSVALNPFVAGPLGSQSQILSNLSDLVAKATTRAFAINSFVRGELFSLPAGPAEAAFGGEYDRESLSSYSCCFGSPPLKKSAYSRRSTAVFAELRVPLLSDHRGALPRDVLSMSIAGRYDHFSDFGGTANPQLGIAWRPIETLTIRGNYGTAFKAPTMSSLLAPQETSPNTVSDPKTGQTGVGITVLRGGNPDLDPMQGTSKSIGLVWSSQVKPGLQASIAHWNVQESDAITLLNAQVIVNNEDALPGLVVRDAAGQITQVNSIPVNFGSVEVAGIDYLISDRYQTSYGIFSPSVSATQTYHYEAALLPGTAAVDGVSAAQDTYLWAPRWKGTASLGWSLGSFSSNIAGRYLGKYTDYNSTRLIGNRWLVDANLRFDIGHSSSAAMSRWKGTFAEIGGVNVFNKSPQYSSYIFNYVGYDASQDDIRGRFLYLRLGTGW